MLHVLHQDPKPRVGGDEYQETARNEREEGAAGGCTGSPPLVPGIGPSLKV
jgi:hypothetical protein